MEGKLGRDVTPPAVQPWTRMNIIEASSHDAATAYVAANRYQLDDFRPYIYRTHDFGKTWQAVTAGIAADTFVRTVRQDPVRKELLYAGTETGIYVSFDDGDHWQSLQLNLPVVPVTDLTLRDNDLIASTQGRAFWILDDVTPLQHMTAEVEGSKAHVFPPRPAYRTRHARFFGPSGGIGENPPGGVIVYYYLGEAASQPVTLEFQDSSGKTIQKFSSATKAGRGQAAVSGAAGLNRFVWDMRYPDAHGIESGTYVFGASLRGPEAVPGDYKVKLTSGDGADTQSFQIKKDPRLPTTQEEYRKQFDLLIAVRDKVSAAHDAINEIQKTQKQIESASQKAGADSALAESARKLNGELDGLLHTLYEPRFTGFDDQTLIYELRLNNRMAALQNYVQGDYGPTEQDYQVFKEVSAELDQTLASLKQILDVAVPAFNSRLKANGLPAIGVELRGNLIE